MPLYLDLNLINLSQTILLHILKTFPFKNIRLFRCGAETEMAAFL